MKREARCVAPYPGAVSGVTSAVHIDRINRRSDVSVGKALAAALMGRDDM
jgi:hypothetical protein